MVGGCYIPGGRVQPDVEVLVIFAGYFETKVRPVAGYVPILEPLRDPVVYESSDLRLQATGSGGPRVQVFSEIAQSHKKVARGPHLRRGAAGSALGVFEVRRSIGCAAGLADVAVLVNAAAVWARPFDEAIRQEAAARAAIELLDVSFDDMAALLGL